MTLEAEVNKYSRMFRNSQEELKSLEEKLNRNHKEKERLIVGKDEV